ncbi:MAG: NUDIX hydrolase [Chloroflexi bacterium]|nr:MAG: NUDIX hydrolase [Chloroflexota bacterium]
MEERIESQSVYNGKLFQVFKDRVRLPNGNATTREIVRHPGSVAIVPRHKDGRVVLVRQYRYVTGRELWEIPAGTLELDESFSVNPFDVHDLQVLRSSGELQDAKTLLGLAWAGVPLWDEPRPRR